MQDNDLIIELGKRMKTLLDGVSADLDQALRTSKADAVLGTVVTTDRSIERIQALQEAAASIRDV